MKLPSQTFFLIHLHQKNILIFLPFLLLELSYNSNKFLPFWNLQYCVPTESLILVFHQGPDYKLNLQWCLIVFHTAFKF